MASKGPRLTSVPASTNEKNAATDIKTPKNNAATAIADYIGAKASGFFSREDRLTAFLQKGSTFVGVSPINLSDDAPPDEQEFTLRNATITDGADSSDDKAELAKYIAGVRGKVEFLLSEHSISKLQDFTVRIVLSSESTTKEGAPDRYERAKGLKDIPKFPKR